MTSELPQAVKTCLWSYDTDRIDLANADHRRRVVENVLNRGTMDAVTWLFTHVSHSDITDTIKRSADTSWNKKSLSLWSLVFDVRPERASRFT